MKSWICLFVLCFVGWQTRPADAKAEVFNLADFNYDAIMSHNDYRFEHGVDPLILNERLIELAQDMANKSALIGKYPTTRPTFRGLAPGALYATITGYKHFNGHNLSDLWYTSYDRNGLKTNGQMIWKSTRMAGFGRAKCKISGKIYMVGFYYPPGNVIGEEDENILPLTTTTKTPTTMPSTTTSTTTTTATTPKPEVELTNNRPYGPGPLVFSNSNLNKNEYESAKEPVYVEYGDNELEIEKLQSSTFANYHEYDEYLSQDEIYEIRRLTRKLRKARTRSELVRRLDKMYLRFSGTTRGSSREALREIDRIISRLENFKRYY